MPPKMLLERTTMRTIWFITFLTLMFSVWSASASEDIKYPVYHHISGYGFTNTWYVTKSRLETIPRWDENGEPPLSAGKALSLAKAWVASKGAGSPTNTCVESIVLRSWSQDYPNSPNRSFWFYKIQFCNTFQYANHMTCIVLLDGSIVEPESEPKSKSDARYLD